jgi:hypothetical protein
MKQKYFFLFGFFFICLSSLYSQIVNEGILKIEALTAVYFEEEYTNQIGAEHHSNGELHFNNNFINNGLTSSISGTTYFEGSLITPQIISGSTKNVNFYNLKVDNTLKGVLVEGSFGLFVTNTINLNNSDLRLVGEAQLIQINNVANIGLGKLLKDQQGTSTTSGYNYWSSPVNNSGTFKLNGGLFDGADSSINPFTPKQMLFNTGSPYNGIPSVTDVGGNVTTAATVNTYWIYTYAPNSSGYAGWVKRDQNFGIVTGTGFSMKGTGATNQNYVFKGTPNNGDYTFPIVVGQSVLLGNPYPSALDAKKFIEDNDDTNVVSQIYFWVDGGTSSHYLSDYLGGYATRNKLTGAPPSIIPGGIGGLGTAGGTSPGQYIAVGQGFFIDATGSGNINFKNSQRAFVVESSDSKFYKTDKKANVNEIETDITENSLIRLGYSDPEGFHRQIVLGFVPNSSADINYNPGYDALMADPRADELFFIIENNLTKKYVIQGVGSYNNLYEIPLGLIMSEEGTHTIMLDEVENFTEPVYIIDKVLNTTYNLSESSFELNIPLGTYLDRFQLVFKPVESNTLATDELNKLNFNVFYNKNESILINNRNYTEIIQVQIYNAIGQQLIQINGNTLQQASNIIPFSYQKGVYLVVVESVKGKSTYKIVN